MRWLSQKHYGFGYKTQRSLLPQPTRLCPQGWGSQGPLTHQGQLSGFHCTLSLCPSFSDLERDQA